MKEKKKERPTAVIVESPQQLASELLVAQVALNNLCYYWQQVRGEHPGFFDELETLEDATWELRNRFDETESGLSVPSRLVH